MPPAVVGELAHRALVEAGPSLVMRSEVVRRGLSVNHTQGVTLGVIGAYVVVIALLWNLPYVRWVLWPFKVRFVATCFSLLVCPFIHHFKTFLVGVFVCLGWILQFFTGYRSVEM